MDALGRVGSAEAEAAVSSYAEDESPQVRKFVVLALRRIGTPQSRAKLKQMAQQDAEGWVRKLAAGQLD